MISPRSLLIVGLLTLFVGTTAQADPLQCPKEGRRLSTKTFTWDERRGNPWDFDPGPAAKESQTWLKLYGSIPNYRNIGKEILKGNSEKFRWMMGPMWYRGRLGKDQVKVFVVGQEGAQDENVSNRAFTGSTGTRTQKFLNHLGIYSSYLFMNTFVYTINSQLDQDAAFKALEQGEQSPIVKYRHQLFDNVMKMNPDKISMFMGVGSGGKASLATWVNARGGKCSAADELKECDTTGMVEYFRNQGINLPAGKKILAIGVPHPGSANPNLGGQAAKRRLVRKFSEAAGRVASFMEDNPGWLPADEEENRFEACSGGPRLERMKKDYVYSGYAPIPFKDFSFGINWRMGARATTSNRFGAHTVQVFSAAGKYGSVGRPREDRRTDPPSYARYRVPREAANQLRDEKKGLLKGMKDNEVPYEPPRFADYGGTNADIGHVSQFDAGPATPELAKALMSWPEFTELNPKAYVSHASFGHGQVYRGNTLDPEVIILADQQSHDGFFSGRVLGGEVGQKFQSFLRKARLVEEKKYLILQPVPVDTIGIETDQVLKMIDSEDKKGQSIYKSNKAILDLIDSKKVILAMGPASQKVANTYAQETGIKVIIIASSKARRYKASWQKASEELNQMMGSSIVRSRQIGGMEIIPRSDLPYSSRWWMGTTGDRAGRGDGTNQFTGDNNSGNYYRIYAPDWVKNMRRLRRDPRPLTDLEQQEVQDTLDSIEE